MTTMKEDSWATLRKYCSESSVLGLKYFYLYPDPVSRCFWAAYLVISLGISMTLTMHLYIRFSEMPTRVTIESQHEPLANLPYPAITICSPNQMTVSASKYFYRSFVNGNKSIDLETALPLILGFDELIADYDNNTLKHLQDLFDVNRYVITGVIAKMAQGCDSFLKFCYYPPDPTKTHCSFLFQPLLTTHGLCCAFNSIYYYNSTNKRNELKSNFVRRSSFGSGFLNSFVVVTDYEPEDAIRETLLNAGAIRLMYTEYNEFPADDETGLLDPHGESFHMMRATHTYCSEEVAELPPKSRECLFSHESKLMFFKRYRNSDCNHLCTVRRVRRACGCWMNFLPGLTVDQACDLTAIPCIIQVKKNMDSWSTDDFCECPRDCEWVQYSADMVIGNLGALPHTYYEQYTGVNITDSTAALHFVFERPVYTKQKQETVMSLISIASNMGGVFGLFLGCSWISLLEILFYMYVCIKNHVIRRMRRNTKHFYH